MTKLSSDTEMACAVRHWAVSHLAGPHDTLTRRTFVSALIVITNIFALSAQELCNKCDGRL